MTAPSDTADQKAQARLRRTLELVPPEERRGVAAFLGAPLERGGRGGVRLWNEDRPAQLLAYVRERCDEVEGVERVEMTNRRAEWLAKPTRPPSLAGFAASIGVSRRTLDRWAKRHPSFRAAVEVARSVYEAWLLDQASTGAIDHRWATFLLRANHGYALTDHLEVAGGLRLEAVRGASYVTADDGPPGELEAGDDD